VAKLAKRERAKGEGGGRTMDGLTQVRSDGWWLADGLKEGKKERQREMPSTEKKQQGK